eukprot:TRINITY_DN25012_c0_g1_i1.p1 TRINITY_DN25012_c0_g1~~TRINITY_DN25012_c0_g1_i1.p1  ORF type:complete len:1090 (-),score=106.17 TRINITY_DN25012_c0_g1_i1:199-3468(-)
MTTCTMNLGLTVPPLVWWCVGAMNPAFSPQDTPWSNEATYAQKMPLHLKPCPSDGSPPQDETCTFKVSNDDLAYTINGHRQPNLTLHRGKSYVFNVQVSEEHKFALSTGENGPIYNSEDGLCDANGLQIDFQNPSETDGVVVFAPGLDTPAQLHYYCINKPNMGGQIRVLGGEAVQCGLNSTVVSRVDDQENPMFTHGLVMYAAFGVVLPLAIFMVRLGQKWLHRILAIIGIALGAGGVALAVISKHERGSPHLASAHGVLGAIIIVGAVVLQPLTLALGSMFQHRRQGAVIFIAGTANIIQGMYLVDLPFVLQLAEIGFLALLVMVFIMYQPASSKFDRVSDEVELRTGEELATSAAVGSTERSEARRTVTVAPAEDGWMSKAATGIKGFFRPTPADEQRLMKMLPSEMREKRKSVKPGYLSRSDMVLFVGQVLKANKLTIDDSGRGKLIDALMSATDADGDGFVSLAELNELLAKRNLTINGEGTLERIAKPVPADVGGDRDERRLAKSVNDEAQYIPDYLEWTSTAFSRFRRRVNDDWPKFMLILLFVCINLLCFCLNFAAYACWLSPSSQECMPAPWAVCVAKGAGMALNFDCAVIVLPMCRRTLTALRSVFFLRNLFPFDSAYDFHLLCGWTIAFMTLVHVVAHYTNYYLSNSDVTPATNAITTPEGLTGHILLSALILMCVSALDRFRRSTYFHVFFFIHHLFVLFFIVLFVHGKNFIGPNYWKFATFPLLLYVCEKARRLSKTDQRHELRIIEARRLADSVTLLKFEKPAKFRYLPGQYCFVAVPALSVHSFAQEFHPFTISSAPHEPFLTLHIRSAGDWTCRLHSFADPALGTPPLDGSRKKLDTVLLDGPYGSASEEVYDFDIAIMVGAGIGVTPFASILKDVQHKLDTLNKIFTKCDLDLILLRELIDVLGFRTTLPKLPGMRSSGDDSNARTPVSLEKLYFFWTTRAQGAFAWFGDMLRTISSEDGDRPWKIEVATYITGAKIDENKDLGSLFLQLGLDLVLEQTGVSLLSGHNRGTRFERPDWPTIFGQIARDHPGKSIGVFYCGPSTLGDILNNQCTAENERLADGTRFTFKTEVF